MSRNRASRRTPRQTYTNASLPRRFSLLFRPGVDSRFDAANVLISEGKVTSFVDYFDSTHRLTQANSALQISAPATRTGFGGKMVGQFGATQYYDSTRAAAAWQCMHDGTGFECFFVFEASAVTTMALVANRGFGGATPAGANLACSAANSVSFETANGSTISSSFGGGATTAGLPIYVSAFVSSGGSPQQGAYRKAVLVDSDSMSAYASPTNTLRLGADTSAGFRFNGYFRAFYTFKRVLTASERSLVRQFIAYDTGIV